jgi:hypothetical protein
MIKGYNDPKQLSALRSYSISVLRGLHFVAWGVLWRGNQMFSQKNYMASWKGLVATVAMNSPGFSMADGCVTQSMDKSFVKEVDESLVESQDQPIDSQHFRRRSWPTQLLTALRWH